MRRLTVAMAVLTIGASEAKAFECPPVGDSCPVGTAQEKYGFELPFFGIFNDNLILGQVDLFFGKTLAACVNGDLKVDGFKIRPTQVRDAVVCTDGGNDTVRVLGSGETATCRFLGLPITMSAWQNNGFALAIFGQSGDDKITGGDSGKEVLCGQSGNDKLFGRENINELGGGQGNDDIVGGKDLDYMFGNEGDDVIVDTGTGGWRAVCNINGEKKTPSRIEGGSGADCIQVPPITEPGWCFAQEEGCDEAAGIPCHAGLWCGPDRDRMDTPALNLGKDCEVKTNGQACQLR